MDRKEAEQQVAPYVTRIRQFQAVSHADALALLGEERFERMLKSPIRSLGPTPETVYPWNVADFIQHPDLDIPHA